MAIAVRRNGMKGSASTSNAPLMRPPREAPGITSGTAARTVDATSSTHGTGLRGKATVSVIKAATPSHETSHPDSMATMSLLNLRPSSPPSQNMPERSH
jgi:hypothetical protein